MGHFLKIKMRRFKRECAQFIFNKGPIYTHDGASAKFSTNSHKTDNSVGEESTVKGLNPFVPSVGQIWPEEYNERRSHHLPPGWTILVPLLHLSCIR
jgi:hypothetical protein